MASNSSIQQHEPLRIPSNWGKEEKRFVAQLEEVLDDLFRRFNRLRMEDLGIALRNTITDAEGNAAEAIRTAKGFEERVTDAEGNASQALQTAEGLETRVTAAETGVANAQSAVNQNAKAFEAKFDSIGANGVNTQTGITSITQDGVKVEHSKIGGHTEINADGMRVYDESGNVVGGTYKLGDKVVSSSGTIINPEKPSFQADVNESDDAFSKVIGLGLKINGELLGIVGGNPRAQGADGGVSPNLWIATSLGTGIVLRATNSDGTFDHVMIGDGDVYFDLRDGAFSIKDLLGGGGGGNLGGIKVAFGHTSVNDSDATILDYSGAGFTDIPSVCVNYSSPTRWSGDAGALKVYYKTTTQANVIVGGSFPTSREIDWIAIGY